MKKLLSILIALSLVSPLAVQAQSVLQLYQGGTGVSTSTTGSLLVGSSSNRFRYSSLPVGATGSVLLASSTSPFGLAYVATSSLGLGGSSGTVSSVDMTVPTGLTVSGNPITTSGTLAVSLQSGYNIPTNASTTAWNDFYTTPSNRITAGANCSWTGNTFNCTGGAGTVTSVNMSVPTGLTISGNPITTSGTLALGLDTGYVIPTTASTTQWTQAYASTTILTNPYIRGLLSGTSPITYNNSTGAIGFDLNVANTFNATQTIPDLITTKIKANSSAGMTLYSNSGNQIALMGAGGGAGVTFYDGVALNSLSDGCLYTSSNVITSTGAACGSGGGGITSLGGQTGATQTFATSTIEKGFSITSSANVHTLNLSVASATNTGLLASSDWSDFKQAVASTTALTVNYIRGLFSGSSPITYNSGTGAIGFDFSTNNTWTGGNTFGNATSTNFTATTNAYLQGRLYDSAVSSGAVGDVLVSTATSTRWMATSTLGITGTSQWTTSGSNIYYNTGNVGIGNSSPGAPLDIVSSGDATLRIRSTASNQYVGQNMYSSGGALAASFQYGNSGVGTLPASFFMGPRINNEPMIFVRGSSATESARFDGNGNLGIGSTTPSTKLDVAGNMLVGTTSSPAFYVNTGIGDGDNRVGINTRAPSYALTVAVDANTDGILVRRNSTSADAEARLGFRISNSDGVPFAYIAGIRRNTPVAGDSDLAFVNQVGGTLRETMRIDTFQRVGIGTSTPLTHLQVTATTTNATSTFTVGKPWQTKGSCLELYDSAGAAIYAFVEPGETTFTLSSVSCK